MRSLADNWDYAGGCDYEWPRDHITNFAEEMRPFYVEALRLFTLVDPECASQLRISDKAERYPDYGGALYGVGKGDLTVFWAIVDSLRAAKVVSP